MGQIFPISTLVCVNDRFPASPSSDEITRVLIKIPPFEKCNACSRASHHFCGGSRKRGRRHPNRDHEGGGGG
ncbi:hypothetical protein GWI33_011941 [Rhynchophorus ferrugineus]|uniref:Uncharacterized protein n=1 Tax=Rhynchophorus ferrugineus TaxID=354439 RepID=A0A834MLW4_RHYFE|nr:hypothetical protein GWI33_011941 [Rhynchophorus ferrugineus]